MRSLVPDLHEHAGSRSPQYGRGYPNPGRSVSPAAEILRYLSRPLPLIPTPVGISTSRSPSFRVQMA